MRSCLKRPNIAAAELLWLLSHSRLHRSSDSIHDSGVRARAGLAGEGRRGLGVGGRCNHNVLYTVMPRLRGPHRPPRTSRSATWMQKQKVFLQAHAWTSPSSPAQRMGVEGAEWCQPCLLTCTNTSTCGVTWYRGETRQGGE